MLAIHGGAPVRSSPMPTREAFGDAEVAMLNEAVAYYRSRNQDPPYEGVFEQRLCGAFTEFMEGGYADAVATGTAACFIALAALDLPKGSEVILSPVTDSGPLNAILHLGLRPVVADAAPGSYNMGVDQFLERVGPNTSAVFAVHAAGEPLEIDRLVEAAHRRGIKVVEDCSQAPGAVWAGRKVGGFGDIAAFSTMYRKSLHSGGSGGIVYSRDLDLHRQALAHADRGKPVWRSDLDLRNPGHALFPALNFNTDELSCAIGIASLGRLRDAIDRRNAFLSLLTKGLRVRSRACQPYNFHSGFSPFYFPIFVDTAKLACSKQDFATALQAEGIDLGAHYGCVVSSWEYARPYVKQPCRTPNADDTRDRSFNLFVNERYGRQEAEDVVNAIVKVESGFWGAGDYPSIPERTDEA